MRLICIEEHAFDPAIERAAQPTRRREAPYFGLQSAHDPDTERPTGDRPRFVGIDRAMALGGDLGEGRIRNMDTHGIDMQVVSYSSPAQWAPAEDAVTLTQDANNRMAEASSANPARLSGFAALPWQLPSAAADELERAVAELGLKGALIIGRPSEKFLDDAIYAPVLQKFNDLGVPLYLHPGPPLLQVQQPYYGGLKPEVSAAFSLAAWGWHNEAGVHLLRLILAGVFERYPKLQVISGHWGELVPFLLDRLDDRMPPEVTGLSTTITDTYRRHVWVSPSGMFYRPHFDFIREVIGIDRIIWAVDYPYVSLDGTRKFIESLAISDEDAARITHRNAEELLGL